MKVGWAYMGIAAILIVIGAYSAFGGNAYGDFIMLISLPFIYVGSNSLADDRKANQAAANNESDD